MKVQNSTRLPKARSPERPNKNFITENNGTLARKLVIESRNMWSPTLKVPPVLRGFVEKKQQIQEIIFNPEEVSSKQLFKSKTTMSANSQNKAIYENTLNQLETTGRPVFSSINLTPNPDLLAAQAASIQKGFSPQRLCNVLQKLNILPQSPKKQYMNKSMQQTISDPSTYKRHINQSQILPHLEGYNFYPYSFTLLLTEKTNIPTESLLLDYNKHALQNMRMCDAIPKRVPGSEFFEDSRGVITQRTFKPSSQPQQNVQLNKAAERALQMKQRDQNAQILAFAVTSSIYQSVVRLKSDVATNITSIVSKAFAEDGNQPDPKNLDDTHIRACARLLEENVVGKLKTYACQLTDPDIQYQNQFLTLLKSISTLMTAGPQVRDAFASNGFLDQLTVKINQVLQNQKKFTLNSTYFMQEDFYVALVTIMRLYYISATALMNDMANLLGFIMQQLLENVNKHQEKKLRKQYQDDILDNTEDFSNEEQPEYIDSKMKGLLLNKLVKNEMYEDCAGFQTIDTMVNRKLENELIKEPSHKQQVKLTEFDTACFVTLLCQQCIFCNLQLIYSDQINGQNCSDNISQLHEILKEVHRLLVQFGQIITVYKESEMEVKFNENFNEYTRDMLQKFKTTNQDGKYLGEELLDCQGWGEQFMQQIAEKILMFIE
ncbi:Conserved_hypothetical protein [Hexamita inflata]|uniref:Uncharacterized protein n=1 Tax=Hexamita inflata TaxID=28002 RepID=A0AA86R793_9EUKA|nr:Conserved hypothetical protein [Hexamita inflata]